MGAVAAVGVVLLFLFLMSLKPKDPKK